MINRLQIALTFILFVTGPSVLSRAGDLRASDLQADPSRLLEQRLTAVEEKLRQLEARVDQALSFPGNADSARTEVTSTAALPDRFEILDQKLRVIERKKELEDEAALTKAKAAPVVSAGKDGFGLRSADSNFNLRVGGYVQADSHFMTSHDSQRPLGASTFLLRRVRPILQGTVYKYFDFRLMPDFGNGQTVLQDAYLDFNYFPGAKIRFGKAKPPVGLERLVSGSEMLFVERAFPTSLVPNRDLGVQVVGDNLAGGVFNYALGVFNGVPDGLSGDLDTNNTKEFAGRVFVLPFRKTSIEPLQGLGLGISGTDGSQEGPLPSFRTSGLVPFFTYAANTVAAGQRHRISPQAYYYWNSLGLLGEYVKSTQTIRRNTTSGEISDEAWQIAGSYVLTGEKASYRGVVPTRMFNPREGAFGAFEVAARYHQLKIDNDTFLLGFANPTASASKAEAWTLGLNWYFDRNLKFNVNYEQTHFTGGGLLGNRPTEKTLLSRFQVYF